MSRIARVSNFCLPALAVTLAGFFGASSVFSQYAPGGAPLKGIVKSSDGSAMEGVTVSVRGEGKTFVTTVFTNQEGAYIFPPLERRKYKLWAQAVGFESARLDVDVAGGKTQQVEALELKPLKDFHTQLSANEWVSSLPEADSNDRRMKAILVSNCSGCHQLGYPLQNRFDTAGWTKIINLMAKFSPWAYAQEGGTPNELTIAYRDEIASYLGRVRGPGSILTPKVLPRPTGDATKVVITEYDLPRPEVSSSILKFDGSDWSEGIPSTHMGRATHDIALDREGNVFWSDAREYHYFETPDRTFGKLDPRTGKVSTYKLDGKDGKAIGAHSVIAASNGDMWAATEGEFTRFDPKTEAFQMFPRPASVPQQPGGIVAIDAKGNVWGASPSGAVELDPETGKYSFHKAVTEGITYGITVDKDDNVWFAQIIADRIGEVDASGKVSEVVLPPAKGDLANDKDHELMTNLWIGPNRFAPSFATPLQKGPRRLWADPKGNYVWVAEYFADQLARIDIHTKEVKEYPLPHRYSQPYGVAVDKDHNVWIDMLGQDRIAKFDPITEQFTEYQMPTRGTEIRHIVTDDSTDPPTVWVPYDRTNKIARIQFRTDSELR